jgi:predicted GNAT family N-acyltransferase
MTKERIAFVDYIRVVACLLVMVVHASEQFYIRQLTTDELYELLRVRSEVFVVEQNCVYQDLDGDDQKAIHLWLMLGDKIVALARVCPAGTHYITNGRKRIVQ